MLASFNLQSTFSSYKFYKESVTPWIIGLIVAAAVCYCLFGGGKRMLKLTGILVPVMGVAYILIALLVMVINIDMLPSVFSKIFSDAFNIKAIFGGFGGSCIMYGIKRGLFSNEAGVGSAPNASASADVSHPTKQGLVQVLSVFIDTILVCSATAFMCMCSGVEPTEKLSGAPYVQVALKTILGQFGPIFITVAMILFAFTTLIGNLYYVDRGIMYLFGKEPGKKFMTIYKILASTIILTGAGLDADLLWGIADITMGAMALINIPVIIILGKYSFMALDNYTKQLNQGVTPTFKASDIGINDSQNYWN